MNDFVTHPPPSPKKHILDPGKYGLNLPEATEQKCLTLSATEAVALQWVTIGKEAIYRSYNYDNISI